MRIDRLDVYYVVMPLIYPWRTAYGEDADIHSVLVKLTSGEHEAWSESTPFFAPTYLNESAGSAFYHVSEVMGPWVVGREYDTAAELDQRLAIFKGNSFAKAAVEIGWWTLQSRITGTPLHRLLGGRTRDVVAGADFGIQDSYDMLLGNIQQAVDAGFPRIKLKAAPGWDLEMLQIVTSTFPDTTFHIDCNSGYTLDDLPFFKAIDGMGLAFIEQPLAYNDLLDHAELAQTDRHAHLSRREHRRSAHRRAGAAHRCLSLHQHQAGQDRRLDQRPRRARYGQGRWRAGVGRGYARKRSGGIDLRGAGDAGELHLPGRPVPLLPLLPPRPVATALGAGRGLRLQALDRRSADAGCRVAGGADLALEGGHAGLIAIRWFVIR